MFNRKLEPIEPGPIAFGSLRVLRLERRQFEAVFYPNAAYPHTLN